MKVEVTLTFEAESVAAGLVSVLLAIDAEQNEIHQSISEISGREAWSVTPDALPSESPTSTGSGEPMEPAPDTAWVYTAEIRSAKALPATLS